MHSRLEINADMSKVSDKHDVISLGEGLYVTNPHGQSINALPAWQLQRGLNKSTHRNNAIAIALRLKAKLEARQAK